MPWETNHGDLEFYRAYPADLKFDGDLARYSFTWAYFFHLICDNLWARRFIETSRQAYPALFAKYGREARGYLKDDWYGLDIRYVRDHPDCSFWQVVMCTPDPPVYLSLIPEAGLHQQLGYIRKFYSEPDPDWMLDRPYPYLNETSMTRFVEDSAASLLKIYARLQAAPAPDDEDTALIFLTSAETCPYPPPLGDPPAAEPL